MRIKAALFGFTALTALYVGALFWVDARRQVFDGLLVLAHVLPLLMGVSLATYGVRFARWRSLLARVGHEIPAGRGFLAYLSGFAFTATPGKVGELLRIRYHLPLGVPTSQVVAAFVFERVLDLVVVLGLAALSIRDLHLMVPTATFVVLCLVIVAIPGCYPAVLAGVKTRLSHWHLMRAARLASILGDAFAECRVWFTMRDLLPGLLCGAVAWGATALAFFHLTVQLGITGLDGRDALALYPMAMLAGAASLLPGGIGSTEVALVALLTGAGAALPAAVLAAVGIRLATLWFAIACGLMAVIVLEWRRATQPPTAPHLVN